LSGIAEVTEQIANLARVTRRSLDVTVLGEKVDSAGVDDAGEVAPPARRRKRNR
jgi:hypothetical protein